MTTNHLTDFKTTYESLKEMEDWKFFIHLYHHDFNGEPFLTIGSYIETLRLEYVSEYGLIITIITPETILSFSEKNYYTNVSNGATVFASKYDNQTHCIIEFG